MMLDWNLTSYGLGVDSRRRPPEKQGLDWSAVGSEHDGAN